MINLTPDFLKQCPNLNLAGDRRILSWSNYRFTILPRRASVALVGDAAATAQPHMGFGVSKVGGEALGGWPI
jgi:2-polyprenyl-6-methoxyphenol hydroxylase-like FAD-dependent oxidoreductase